MKLKPMLFTGGLTGRIYLATRYTDKGNGQFVAHTKYDITNQFLNLMAQIQSDDWPFEYKPVVPDGRLVDQEKADLLADEELQRAAASDEKVEFSWEKERNHGS